MIATAAGRVRQARRRLTRALALNPAFDLHQASIARAALAALDVPDRIARTPTPR
jgi:hypothetical protein